MPLPVVAECDRPACVAKLHDDFKLLLIKFDVEEDVMAELGKYNIATESKFSKLAGTEDSFREWCVKMLGLDAEIEDSVKVASLSEALGAVKGRIESSQKATDEARALGFPFTILNGQYVTARRNYHDKVGSLGAEETPSKSYLELRYEQIDKGGLKAETLAEVVSKIGGRQSRGSWQSAGPR